MTCGDIIVLLYYFFESLLLLIMSYSGDIALLYYP